MGLPKRPRRACMGGLQHPNELMSRNGSLEAAPASPNGCHEMGLPKRPRQACWGFLWVALAVGWILVSRVGEAQHPGPMVAAGGTPEPSKP
eukprot:4534606-Alexandrium_andersonii.AAC.1